MVASWQQVLTDLQQIGGDQPLLPMLFFGVGIIALAWVIRRSATRKNRDAAVMMCLKARSIKAHTEIADITCRDWHHRYTQAIKFPRGSDLPGADQLKLLQELSAWQRSTGGSHG